MSFTIVHEVRGSFPGVYRNARSRSRGRLRCRSSLVIPEERANALADELIGIRGVGGVTINGRTGSVTAYYADDACRLSVLRCLARAGDDMEAAARRSGRASAQAVPDGGPMAAAMQVVRYFAMKPFMPAWLSIISSVLHAVPYVRKGLADLLRLRVRVSVLDASAIIVCFARLDYSTARTLTLLLGVGDTLEEWTRQKSLDSLTDCLNVTTDTVWVRDDNGEERQARLRDVASGDIVIIRSGTSIPVDGVVVDGEAVVNQSAMTGEPIGVVRNAGCSVFAGTVVEEGEIAIRVSSVGDGTRLRQIVNFIEESEALKAGVQGRFERMADMAVPFTFGLAALVWFATRDPIRASSVLLVDYSCALKLTTPLTVLAAMREGAVNGVVVKGGRYLEALRDVDTVVFDKTGTLTNATPRVAAVIPAPGFESNDVLRTMACLEEHFPHPVARAVVYAAEERELAHPEMHSDVQYVVAHGVCSLVDGEKVVVGSRHYIEEDEGIDLSPLAGPIADQTALGRSLLFVARGDRVAGLVAISDPPRPEARETIRALYSHGVDRVLMITGDDERTAKAIAGYLGIREYRAQVLPTDKSDIVAALEAEGRHVLMVGDGINDAPALSAASVGVAMSDGTDLAQGVANVLLTRPDLNGIVTAKILGTRSLGRIHQNFIATMALNSLFLAGGITMLLTPGMSALLHNMTTFLLALRAMRKNLRPDETVPVGA